MKREYNTPTVEKISFRYRDQIVVASGDNGAGGSSGNRELGSWNEGEWDFSNCDIYLAEVIGLGICN